LGRHPQHFGEALISFFENMIPPQPSALWKNRSFVRRLLNTKPKNISSGISRQFVMAPDLDSFPIRASRQDVQEPANFFERRESACQVGVKDEVMFSDDF
jgi:hypothetical protein